MRIFIFSNRDIASNYHLNLILPSIHTYVKGIFLSDAVGKKTTISPPQALKEMKFIEQQFPNDFLFPQIDAQGSKKEPKLLTFNELSKKFNIPIQSCNDVKSLESIAFFHTLNIDIILSVRFGKIFGSEFIKIPTQGILNLHSGLLPNYRGVLATFRALQHGDSKLSATLHWIDDATIDTGKIIGFSTIEADKKRSVLWNILQLYPASIPLTIKTLQQVINGEKEQIISLPNEGGAYFSFPHEAEINAFIDSGWTFCNWQDMKEFYEQYF
jgi:methionyl-tRNA formyltransferase